MLAWQVYNSVIRRFMHSNDATLLLYLARAYYDADQLADARGVLLKASHIRPSDYRLQFNVALTMQVWIVKRSSLAPLSSLFAKHIPLQSCHPPSSLMLVVEEGCRNDRKLVCAHRSLQCACSERQRRMTGKPGS
jgi:hypothetical protein